MGEDCSLHDITNCGLAIGPNKAAGLCSSVIGIRTSGSEFFDEQHCFLVLICVEECDGLKYRMKQRVCETEFDLP
jgi:hypothetical protein